MTKGRITPPAAAGARDREKDAGVSQEARSESGEGPLSGRDGWFERISVLKDRRSRTDRSTTRQGICVNPECQRRRDLEQVK